MDSNNQNKDAKSKIEKIRIDLEKKLAALEAVKLKFANKANLIVEKAEDVVEKAEDVVEKTEDVVEKIEDVVEKTEDVVEKSETITENNEVDTNRSFIEQISDIENSSNLDNFKVKETKEVDKENKVLPIDVSVTKDFKEEKTIVENKELIETSEETFFEITDKIENIEDDISIKENVKIAPIIAAKIDEKISVQNTDSTEEKVKSSNLNYLIYALAAIVVLGISYLGWNYLSKSSKNKDKIFSEFENQKYKDSIELADAKNQLSDFISQRYIDSIANVNQILLDGNNSSESPAKNSERPAKNSERPAKNNSNRPKNRPKVVVNNNLPSFSSLDIKQTTNPSLVNTNTELSNNDIEVNSSNATNDDSSEKSDVAVENKPKKTETLSTIEKSPIYPGCEKKTTELAKKKCLMSKVARFVQNKFKGDLSQNLGLDAGRKKINVQFIIDKNGNAIVLRVRGQHKVLEKEALRVVNSLPKMKPGRKAGKTEPIIYNLPIIYNVEY